MNMSTKLIHRVAAMMAFFMILVFFSSTLLVEIAGSKQSILEVKRAISYAIFLLIPTMAIVGITGSKMAGSSQHPTLVAKKKRTPIIALNGLLILTPSAFYLYHLAEQDQFNNIFYAVQALELIAGLVNLSLMGLNIRDGIAMSKRRSLAR
ncbi:hypothetical protein [uncultured Vibrio sp.]|uniref:hypothetical protein n=1 Tax=uncultured Vibrio sp. TaxID=114054 RepID=UPI0025D06490|nr:hypothetical protein [uncultured Vibrio sp.]